LEKELQSPLLLFLVCSSLLFSQRLLPLVTETMREVKERVGLA
jgi:hypothetical protein